MNNPQRVLNDWISSDPESKTVNNVRPGVDKTWVTSKDSNSAIMIRLVDMGEEPVAVGKIVLESNADTAEIFYKPSDAAEEEFVPISRNADQEPLVRTGYPSSFQNILCPDVSICCENMFSEMNQIGQLLLISVTFLAYALADCSLFTGVHTS